MQLLTLDFETTYSKTYSLSKMTTEAYVNDPQFEVVGVAVKINEEPTQWFTGNMMETAQWLAQFDWGNSIVVAHNALFDGAILGWRFNIHPKVIVCTLSMARALHAVSVGGSLAAMSEYYGLGKKGTEVHDALGKRRLDFSQAEIEAYGGYCVNDVELTYKLFQAMLPSVNKAELKLIDITIRMYTNPMFKLDREVLDLHLIDVREQKDKLLEECGIVKEDLMSNNKLAVVLESLGVEVPMKLNSKGVQAFAFAKTDEGFKALSEHDDPRVQAIVAARLGTKSTLEETRTERFIAIAERPNRKSFLPVPLLYYGARTGRWAATDKINLQNLPRKSKLKSAIVAPEGHVIIGADLSAIELRMGLAFAGQLDKMNMLGAGVDLYKDFAANIYNITSNEVNDSQRFMGKTCIAEGELVLTERGLIPIEKIKLDDRVWDGVEWVNHQGLIYKGEKDVIRYQGLTATPDHIVYLGDGSTCEFGDAAYKAKSIANTGHGRQTVLLVENSKPRGKNQQQERGTSHISSMRLRYREMVAPRVFRTWVIETVQGLRDEETTQRRGAFGSGRYVNSQTSEKSERYVSKMQQYKRQGIQKLWATRDSVYVCIRSRMRELYENATKLLNRSYSGSHRQQWALCGGESEICFYEGANSKPAKHPLRELERGANTCRPMERKSLCSAVNNMQIYSNGVDGGTDSRTSLEFCTQQMQRVEHIKGKVRVYDLINAGPRHRFTVSNKLVSNCSLSLIYGTGAVKLRNQVKLMSGVDIGEEEAERIVEIYRGEYTSVVAAWGEGDKVLEAVANNTYTVMGRGDLIQVHGSQGALLPSGLYMRYPDLMKKRAGTRYEWSVMKNKRERDKLYGSKVYQGLTQALARCIIAEAMLRVDKRYRIGLTIHDALYVIAPEDEADEALRFIIAELRKAPDWMPDIPLDAEGGFGRSLEFKMGKII